MSTATEHMQKALEFVGTEPTQAKGKQPGWFAETKKTHAAALDRRRWSRAHTQQVRMYGVDGRAGV